MPSATGQNWEKYQKTFADDEEPEKKITPLTDEYVEVLFGGRICADDVKGYPSPQDLWSCAVCGRSEEA